MKKTNHTDHLPLPILRPGSLLNACIAVSPVRMACFPNSNCTATLARQEMMMIQSAAKPAFAPNTVVAINSPDPTMEAERIKPGPRNARLRMKVEGGSFIVLFEMTY